MQTIRDNRIVFFFSPLNITSQGTVKYVRNRHTSDLYISLKWTYRDRNKKGLGNYLVSDRIPELQCWEAPEKLCKGEWILERGKLREADLAQITWLGKRRIGIQSPDPRACSSHPALLIHPPHLKLALLADSISSLILSSWLAPVDFCSYPVCPHGQ